MKRLVQKLDEATVRREFPIVGLVDGWFFRCRLVAVGNVYRVEGTDLWGEKFTAEGTDTENLLQDCADRARRMDRHVQATLFGEYGTSLRLEGNDLVLNVLCGTVGQFGVEIVLNEAEREKYKREGDSFIVELANLVLRDPNAYRSRGRFC